MRDYREPTRMGWEALLVLVVKGLWSYIKSFWAIFLLFSLGKGGKNNAIIGIIVVLLALIVLWNVLVRYFTTKLWIRDGKLVCTSGLLSKKEESFPLNRIHALRTRRNPIYQLVDMVGVVFDTVAEKGNELEFVMSVEDWTMLSQLVEEEEVSKTSEKSRGVDQPLWQYRMGLLQLLRAALVQNHFKGMALIGGALSFLYGQIPDNEQYIDWFVRYLENNFESLVGGLSVIFVLFLLVAGYLISLLIWCAYTLIKYWGLTLDFYPNHLVYKAGLLNKVTIKLYKDKVIALSSKANPLEKLLGLNSFMLEQATNVEGVKGENIIVIPGAACLHALTEWLYGEKEPAVLYRANSQKPLFWYSFITIWLLFVPLFIAIIFWVEVFGVLISMAITVAILYLSRLKLLKSNIQLRDDYIELSSGFLADRKTLIRYKDIEHTETRQMSLWGFQSKNYRIRLFTKGNTKSIRSISALSSSKVVSYLQFRSNIFAKN